MDQSGNWFEEKIHEKARNVGYYLS